ncbi:beta-lactamase family protein [Streptomyces sp. NBC_01693]|uniref:serine hydrolase domain-containing protein n=1 Tax=Streptomyces sp. NBC_01693 TaxID=2975912 RepID=UPI002E3427AE|nr:serine hydrolase domain-containing protein [Streptomyces sp. NBC_01693]
MTELNGTVSPTFEPVRDAVQDQLRSGTEVGMSLVVVIDGRHVVNLWGGHRDAARTQPWQRDTITNVWSITKTVTGLAALLLVDAGELDLDAPVARYWPEFATKGKQHVEVRHLLSHTSGVSGLEHPAQLDDLYDVRAASARMASQAPWWRPGSASGYHVLSYGHLVGELVHRLTGLPLRDFVHQHLVRPVGADFRIGLPAEDVPRSPTSSRRNVTSILRHSITTPWRTRRSPALRSTRARPTPRPGELPSRVRPTVTGTPCPWPRSSPPSPAREPPPTAGSSSPAPSTASSASSPVAPTSSTDCTCDGASDTRSPTDAHCPGSPTAVSRSGAAGVARWRPWTATGA